MEQQPDGPSEPWDGGYKGTTRTRMETAPPVPPGPTGDLARLLRERRVEMGLSQSHVAHLMAERGHAWHQTTVVKTERAEREPRYTELLALAQVFKTTPASLIGLAPEAGECGSELLTLELQERELTLRTDFIARDLERLKHEHEDLQQRLRQIRSAMTAARKAQPDG